MCTTSDPTVILEATATSRNVIPVFQVPPGAWVLGGLSAALAISLLFLYSWRFPWWQLAFPMGPLVLVLPHQPAGVGTKRALGDTGSFL